MALFRISILSLLVLSSVIMVTAKIQEDPAANQMVTFKENTPGPIGIMTTASGAPVNCNNTFTLNKGLIRNAFFMEQVTHLFRERIPERAVHAKGGGAFGYFEVTHDVTDICKAKFLRKVGKRTPIAIRFSAVLAEKGGVDTGSDVRGFAVKFYTEEGNFDIAGLNTPVYSYKEPILFPAFIRSLKKNPVTNLEDSNARWDFLTLHPETLNVFMYVFSQRSVPDGYRHMPGFSVHTYQVVNEKGDKYFIRFHFQPNQGIRNLRTAEAKKIGGEQPDYANKDLYNAIAKGEFPSWTASIQVLSWTDVQNAGFDVFDITKLLPLDKYPLRRLGRLVLDRNPVNYFAEIEQLAFSPINLVPGILGAPDKVFESRCLSYRDAQYYRLGGNYFNIPVNCPLRRPLTYNRDGVPPVNDNMRDIPNYYPNSFHGPVPYKESGPVEVIEIHEEEPNNLAQTGEIYKGMSSDEKKMVVENIVTTLGDAAKFLQERALKLFKLIDPDLNERVQAALDAAEQNKG